jgi:hypothetical protein
MSGISDRLRAVRAAWAARRRDRKVKAGERALRRAEAQAQHRKHATFDEGRRDPGGPGI